MPNFLPKSLSLRMSKEPYQVLRVARWVFLVMAYLVAGVNLIFAGIIPLFAGGDPVPLLTGEEVPARLFGLMNIVLGAPLGFLFFYLPSGLIHLLLDIRGRLTKTG